MMLETFTSLFLTLSTKGQAGKIPFQTKYILHEVLGRTVHIGKGMFLQFLT